jgi:hypothetical protein
MLQTSPPGGGSSACVGSVAHAPAALTRGLGVVAAFAGGSPVALVPEQPLVAAMRRHVVDHRRRHHAPLGLACRAQRVLRQKGGPGPAPTGTVAPAGRARPLAVQRALHLRRALRPRRTVHGRLRGQRRLLQTNGDVQVPSRPIARARSRSASATSPAAPCGASVNCGWLLSLLKPAGTDAPCGVRLSRPGRPIHCPHAARSPTARRRPRARSARGR